MSEYKFYSFIFLQHKKKRNSITYHDYQNKEKQKMAQKVIECLMIFVIINSLFKFFSLVFLQTPIIK
ncbi:hypothetical protein pb186bvf_014435 [Paramecium bursaria]